MDKRRNHNTHEMGNRIAVIRNDRGFTQKKLSIESGLSVEVISKAETGGSVQADTLITIAETLNVSLDYIVWGLEGLSYDGYFSILNEKEKASVISVLEAFAEGK